MADGHKDGAMLSHGHLAHTTLSNLDYDAKDLPPNGLRFSKNRMVTHVCPHEHDPALVYGYIGEQYGVIPRVALRLCGEPAPNLEPVPRDVTPAARLRAALSKPAEPYPRRPALNACQRFKPAVDQPMRMPVRASKEGHLIALRGWLWKGNRKGKGWKKRYFVLENNKLLYFDRQEDRKPAGEMDLVGWTFEEDVPSRYDRPYAFTITAISRPFPMALAGEAEEERATWIAHLADAMDYVSPHQAAKRALQLQAAATPGTETWLRIVTEFIAMEEWYLEELQFAVTSYVKPIVDRFASLIPPDQMESLFMLFCSVYNLTDYLLNHLYTILATGGPRQIGELFSALEDSFNLYPQYAASHDSTASMFESLYKKIDSLQHFFKMELDDGAGKVRSRTLQQSMLLPIEHAHAYAQLLEDLWRVAPAEQRAYIEVPRPRFVKIATDLNPATPLFVSLSGWKDKDKGARRLVFADTVDVGIGDAPKKFTARDVILYSDTLLILKGDSERKVDFVCPLEAVTVRDIPDSDAVHYGIHVTTPKQPYIFVCPSDYAKMRWLRHLSNGAVQLTLRPAPAVHRKPGSLAARPVRLIRPGTDVPLATSGGMDAYVAAYGPGPARPPRSMTISSADGTTSPLHSSPPHTPTSALAPMPPTSARASVGAGVGGSMLASALAPSVMGASVPPRRSASVSAVAPPPEVAGDEVGRLRWENARLEARLVELGQQLVEQGAPWAPAPGDTPSIAVKKARIQELAAEIDAERLGISLPPPVSLTTPLPLPPPPLLPVST